MQYIMTKTPSLAAEDKLQTMKRSGKWSYRAIYINNLVLYFLTKL